MLKNKEIKSPHPVRLPLPRHPIPTLKWPFEEEIEMSAAFFKWSKVGVRTSVFPGNR